MRKPTSERSGRERDALSEVAATSEVFEARVRAERPPAEPPTSLAAHLALHWIFQPLELVAIENIDELFTEGLCPECATPRGVRTARRMRVHHWGIADRRVDAVTARPRDQLHPHFPLVSARFLSLLSDEIRRQIRWRPTIATNPTKTTLPLYEPVAAQTTLRPVRLRGGNPDGWRCGTCAYSSIPTYAVAALPDWLNSSGALFHSPDAHPPDVYVAKAKMSARINSLFAIGDWRSGPIIAANEEVVSSLQHTRMGPSGRTLVGKPGTVGIVLRPCGVVTAEGIEP